MSEKILLLSRIRCKLWLLVRLKLIAHTQTPSSGVMIINRILD